jgi:tetratricopeptide (TPR) repeat protein
MEERVMNRYFAIFGILLLSVLGSTAFGSELQTQLQAALDRLDEGISLLEQHDEQSAAALAEASAMLETVIETYQLETPGIYHALGNAYMLKGDLGHAVLAYRKGQQLDPTNLALKESLDFARSQVAVHVEPDFTNRVWSAFLIWRGYVPRAALWIGFIVLFTLGWLTMSARMLGLVSSRLCSVGIWAVLLSLVPAGLLGIEWARTQGSTSVIITGSHVIARTGPDDRIYDPVYTDGIESGVEARLLESRNGWDRIALADGSECWVPDSSIQRINQ